MARPVLAVFAVAGLCALSLTPAVADGGLACSSEHPDGVYQVIALRNASDVASTLATIESYSPAVAEVDFDASSLAWINGEVCLEGWSLSEVEAAPVWLDDPLLSDVMLAPAADLPDRRVLSHWRLDCGARAMGHVTMVDARLLVAASESGAVNVVLEKPLDAETARTLNSALKASGSAVDETETVGAATRDALAQRAESMGAAYRFENTAIGLNLLESLGLTCSE
jgi:hypothetical protein